MMVLGGRTGERERFLVRKDVELPGRQAESSFLAPMWAQRKVGFLLEQIRLNGESEELREEIVRLGERYGIVTPYTAYLVVEERLRALEAAGIDPHAPAAAEAFMARAAISAQTRPDQSVYAGAAGSRQQTGAQAVQLSMAEKTLQSLLQTQQSDLLSVQRLGEKTFRLDESGQVWRDVDLTADQRLEEVEVGSARFLELLEANPELARWAAQGPIVEVQLDRQGYRFVLPKGGA